MPQPLQANSISVEHLRDGIKISLGSKTHTSAGEAEETYATFFMPAAWAEPWAKRLAQITDGMTPPHKDRGVVETLFIRFKQQLAR